MFADLMIFTTLALAAVATTKSHATASTEQFHLLQIHRKQTGHDDARLAERPLALRSALKPTNVRMLRQQLPQISG